MLDETQGERKHGTVAVLALLLSVLFGHVEVLAGRLGTDGRSVLSQSDPAKAGVTLRTAGRTQSDDRDDGAGLLPVDPRMAGRTGTLRPLALGDAQLASAAAGIPHHAYRARAPPAA